MSTFRSQPLALRLRMHADQEHNRMKPDSAFACESWCLRPAEEGESVLLARAACPLHLGKGGLSQAIRSSGLQFVLATQQLLTWKESNAEEQLFYLIPYFIPSCKLLTFSSVTLDPNSSISYFARLLLPWMVLNCSGHVGSTVSGDFSVRHLPIYGSKVFSFESCFRVSWQKYHIIALDGYQ